MESNQQLRDKDEELTRNELRRKQQERALQTQKEIALILSEDALENAADSNKKANIKCFYYLFYVNFFSI